MSGDETRTGFLKLSENSRESKDATPWEMHIRSSDSDQKLASLGAAACEDLAAVSGSHAGTETVNALALDDGRMERAVHS